MNAATEQTEKLFLDLEKRVGVREESTEKLESQLKVMLVRYSGDLATNDLVVRTAKTLASCLRTRGDWEQAEQYAKMADNLERRHGGARLSTGASPIQPEVKQPEAISSLPQERAEGSRPAQVSTGKSLARGWRTSWDLWFMAWGWVLNRKRP